MAFLASCSPTNDASNSPLSYAPANSAFVYGNTEPMPFTPPLSNKDTIKLFAQSMQGSYKKFLERASGNGVVSENGAQAAAETADNFADLIDTLMGGSEKTGIKDQGRSAFYEINGVPVLRIELANAETFKNFVAKVEKTTHSTFAIKTIGKQSYWSIPLPSSKVYAELVLAVQGPHAVFTFYVPAADTPMQTLLGVEKPKQSILDNKEWQTANKDYGLQAYGTLLVRPEKVVERLLGTPETDSWIAQLSHHSKTDFYLNSNCRREIASMAAKVPRIVAGYTKVSASQFDWKATIALEPQLASALTQVPVAVPGVGSAPTQELELGFGIDFQKLAAVIRTQTQAITAAPYECAQLESLNAGAKDAPKILSGLYMTAPFLNGAHFSGQLPKLDWETLSANKDIGNLALDASLWVSSPDPRGVLGMVQGWLPEIRKLQLEVGEAPKRIDLEAAQLSESLGANPVWFITNESGIGLALGNDSLHTLEQSLAATPLKTPAVFSQSVRGSFYTKLLDASVKMQSADAQSASLSESLERTYSLIDYVKADVFFTDKGIEVQQSLLLKRPVE